MFEFQILQWEVTGHSKAIGGHISFTLSDCAQPRSVVVAMQKGSDFPATIVYNAVFDVFLDKKRVLTSQIGLGVATGITQIPPRADVAFQKAFEFGELRFAGGLCACGASLTPTEFEEGVAKVRAVRG